MLNRKTSIHPKRIYTHRTIKRYQKGFRVYYRFRQEGVKPKQGILRGDCKGVELMRGWPNRRRLLWGRRSRMRGLAWPAALLLAIALITGLYFVLPLFSSYQNHGHESTIDVAKSIQIHGDDDPGSANISGADSTEPIRKNQDDTGSYRDVLKIAAVQSALSAAINTSTRDGQMTTHIAIENTGHDLLRRVEIATNGSKVVGVLPELWPGERKTLAVCGDLQKVNITAKDSTGREVISSVHYINPKLTKTALGLGAFLGGGSGSSSETYSEPANKPLAVKNESISENESNAANPNNSSFWNASKNTTKDTAGNKSIVDPKKSGTEPKFNLTIKTNRSEGHAGDVVSFKCTALNVGTASLSDLVLVCGGKKASTTYLTPGKEIHIEDSFLLLDNVLLNATVKGSDINGTIWQSNSTAEVWLISPELGLKAWVLPEKAHRGDKIALSVQAENTGQRKLFNLSISDSFGKVGEVPFLDPGKSATFMSNGTANESILDEIKAKAYTAHGQKVYGSTKLEIKVLSCGLNLTAQPQEVAIYPGQPVDITWILNNTGEENLKNVTLNGDGSRYKLNEISAHASMRISAIYVLNKTSRINVTAKGYSLGGYPVQDSGSVLIKAVSPGISLKVTPADISAFAGEAVDITCLVTNTGNDDLKNVILSQDGDILDRIEKLSPGEFQVFSPKLNLASNATLDFGAQGVDSLGRSWSDASQAKVTLLNSAIEISANGPSSVKWGDSAKITCVLYNPGSVSLFNILVESKAFGPLGLIDYLAPKQQKVLEVDEQVTAEIKDEIKAVGMTSTKHPVTDSCKLHISVLSRPSLSINRELPLSQIQPKPLVLSQKGTGLSQKRSVQAGYGGDNENFKVDAGNQSPVSRNMGFASINISSPSRNISSVSKNLSFGSRDMSVGSRKIGSVPMSANISSNQPTPAGKVNSSKPKASSIQNGLAQRTGLEKGIAAAENEIRASNSDAVINKISVLINYIKKMLTEMGHPTQAVSYQEALPSQSSSDAKSSKNYELAIESVKGSDHGRIKVLDVGAAPPHPFAGTPVKVTVHVSSETGIESASVKFGVRDAPITKMEMPTVDRIYTVPMTLDSGDVKDGYWSCTILGRAAGTYMVLSVALTDGNSLVDDGPYLLHWSAVPQPEVLLGSPSKAPSSSDEGMLFIESSMVRGTGEVSIKDAFDDSAISYNERMKGNGSISLESLRCLDKDSPMVNFTQQRDLVFEGQLQGVKSMESPAFHGGLGASISERFNLSHVDKSETDMIRSLNSSDNTLAFNTDQAFNGTWNIRTQYAQFFQKIKGDQKYSGSFQTEKKIKFQDAGKK
jgi:hypothetical protein